MPNTSVKPASKSDETRARILAAALELFRAKGFEETTMREIALAAGVATGAAYYYFDSKDAIVLAFYDQAQKDMEPRLNEVLDANKDLRMRLKGIIEVKLEYFKSSRRLLGALAGHTDPEHPLSPFSAQTEAIRANDTKSFERALGGSRVRVSDDLREYLPRILWMYQMGIILFWIYDRSSGQKKTRALIDRSLDVVVRLIGFSRLPLTKPLRRIVIDLVDTVTEAV
jgi:AcrR family transcriptional regulator